MSDVDYPTSPGEDDEHGWKWPNMQKLATPTRIRDGDWPPTLRRDIQRYVDHRRKTAVEESSPDLTTHTEKTVDDQMQHVNWFEMWLQMNDMAIEDVTPFDALDIGTYLGNNYSGSVAGTRFRTIRDIYQHLYKGQVVEGNPFADWSTAKDCSIQENKSEQSRQLSEGERYGPTLDEIDQMVENVDEDYQTRDRLVLRLIRDTGCRCNEVRQIRYDDFDFEKREISLPAEICKYNKARDVAYKRDTGVLLHDWLDKYRIKEAYKYSEYLFPTDQSPVISTDTIEEIVKDAAANGGLNEEALWVDANGNGRAKITPHNIRYSTGYYMLFDANDEPRPNANIYQVSNYLGHASVTVTERVYIEENPRAGVEAGHELMPE